MSIPGSAAGLISRERDELDRRLVYLQLTDEGRAKLAELHAKRLALTRRILGPLSEADLDEFMRILGRLASALDGHS